MFRMLRLIRNRISSRFLSRIEALKILKIEENSDLSDLGEKYRYLAKSTHPDAPGGNQEEFLKISEAYTVLRKSESNDDELDDFLRQYQKIVENHSQKKAEAVNDILDEKYKAYIRKEKDRGVPDDQIMSEEEYKKRVSGKNFTNLQWSPIQGVVTIRPPKGVSIRFFPIFGI